MPLTPLVILQYDAVLGREIVDNQRLSMVVIALTRVPHLSQPTNVQHAYPNDVSFDKSKAMSIVEVVAIFIVLRNLMLSSYILVVGRLVAD
ncbi:hypothetical protein AMTR_s00001p00264960 [Amborella trichopoda]|uniref:Uncharacterized protein n=1 Tax=Amborella trichopoda TaxID=13333 RepID=W1NMK9_AMBTC|nr:hypothetical protein AMTR_s00001p00264960 [Amborella trichopoda]